MAKRNKCCLCGSCKFYGNNNHCTLKKDIHKLKELQDENAELKNKLAYIRKRCPEIDEMEQALEGNPNDD